MRRCKGKTVKGSRCLKNATKDSGYCKSHASQAKTTNIAAPGALGGAALGAKVGGLPGAIAGLVIGGVLGSTLEEEILANSRVFISFDYDSDSDLKRLLVGQAKNPDTPFEISDWSVKEHISGDWKKKVKSRLTRVDQMVIICGHHTNAAAGVAAEVELAQDERLPYFLLHGRANGTVYKPKTARSTDKIYDWTWDNLKKLIGGAR